MLALGYQRRREKHFRWIKAEIDAGRFGKLVQAECNISRDRLGQFDLIVLALHGGRHARRRHAADRHPLRRRAGIPDGAGQERVGASGPARAARRQPGRRQHDLAARERRAFQPDGFLRLGVRVLHDEHLRQGGERLLRSVLRPAALEARREDGACGRRRKRTTPSARSSTSSPQCVRNGSQPETDGFWAARNLAVIKAGAKSAREGRVVEVAEILASGE